MALPTWVELSSRLQKFNPQAERLWGKMNAAQMLLHCRIALETALGERQAKRKDTFLWRNVVHPVAMIIPWPKGKLPTAQELQVVEMNQDVRSVAEELAALIGKVKIFSAGKFDPHAHPMFGDLTVEQWLKLQRKHLDHHLRQFGA